MDREATHDMKCVYFIDCFSFLRFTSDNNWPRELLCHTCPCMYVFWCRSSTRYKSTEIEIGSKPFYSVLKSKLRLKGNHEKPGQCFLCFFKSTYYFNTLNWNGITRNFLVFCFLLFGVYRLIDGCITKQPDYL